MPYDLPRPFTSATESIAHACPYPFRLFARPGEACLAAGLGNVPRAVSGVGAGDADRWCAAGTGSLVGAADCRRGSDRDAVARAAGQRTVVAGRALCAV